MLGREPVVGREHHEAELRQQARVVDEGRLVANRPTTGVQQDDGGALLHRRLGKERVEQDRLTVDGGVGDVGLLGHGRRRLALRNGCPADGTERGNAAQQHREQGDSHPTHPGQDRTVSAALVVAIAMALAFAATNGVHDAANSIATLVMTRAARPGPAVVLAAMGNVVGPLLIGSAVANTIAGIVTVPNDEVVVVLGAALHGRGRVEHDHVVARPALELGPRAARRSRRGRTGRRRNVGRQLGWLRRVAARRRARGDHRARDRARPRIRGWVRCRPRRATAHAPRDRPHPRPGTRRTVGDVGRARDQPRRQRCAEGRRRGRAPAAREWRDLLAPRADVGGARVRDRAHPRHRVRRLAHCAHDRRAHRAAAADRRARQPDRLHRGAARRDADGRAR